MRGCSMPAGEKRSCAICVVERTGQGGCRRQVRQNARIVRYGATQPWHCQGLLAGNTRMPPSSGTARFIWQKPPSSGTANVPWRGRGARHSGLALPGIVGVGRAFAAQDWQCQGLLASGSFSPPSVGSARDLWRAESFHHPAPNMKKAPLRELSSLSGGPSGVRTPDLGIKSPLLCQLS